MTQLDTSTLEIFLFFKKRFHWENYFYTKTWDIYLNEPSLQMWLLKSMIAVHYW